MTTKRWNGKKKLLVRGNKTTLRFFIWIFLLLKIFLHNATFNLVLYIPSFTHPTLPTLKCVISIHPFLYSIVINRLDSRIYMVFDIKDISYRSITKFLYSYLRAALRYHTTTLQQAENTKKKMWKHFSCSFLYILDVLYIFFFLFYSSLPFFG